MFYDPPDPSDDYRDGPYTPVGSPLLPIMELLGVGCTLLTFSVLWWFFTH